MSGLWHILLKDLRRLRGPLIAWILIVIARMLVATTGAASTFGDLGLQMAMGNLDFLVTVIDLLTLALLVSWLVHDEPLVGVDAFWLTRPIDPRHLMAAKLVFAAVFLVAAPAAGESIAVAAIAGGFHDAVRAAPGLALARTLWVLPLIALAVLTPSLMRFLMVIVGAMVTVAGLVSVFVTLVFLTVSDDAFDAAASPIEDPTGSIVMSVLLLATALGVILYQYRHRRLRRAVVFGAAGLVVTAAIDSAWPWRFARPAEPDTGAWARDAATAILDTDPPPYVTEAFGLRQRAADRKFIAAPLHFSNMPSDASADSIAVRARLALPGGITLQSAQGTSVSVRRPGRHVIPAQATRMQAALGDVRLLAPDAGEYDMWPVVLKVSAEAYARYGDIPGRLDADVEGFVYRSRLAGSMLLTAGAVLRSGATRFEMLQVARHADGCSVLVRQSMSGSLVQPAVPRTYQLVLRNAMRGEAVTGDSEEFVRTDHLQAGTWFVSRPGVGLGFSFVHLAQRYPARGPFASPPRIDAAWLDGADLAVVETVYAGRVTRSISAEGFKIGSPSTTPAP